MNAEQQPATARRVPPLARTPRTLPCALRLPMQPKARGTTGGLERAASVAGSCRMPCHAGRQAAGGAQAPPSKHEPAGLHPAGCVAAGGWQGTCSTQCHMPAAAAGFSLECTVDIRASHVACRRPGDGKPPPPPHGCCRPESGLYTRLAARRPVSQRTGLHAMRGQAGRAGGAGHPPPHSRSTAGPRLQQALPGAAWHLCSVCWQHNGWQVEGRCWVRKRNQLTDRPPARPGRSGLRSGPSQPRAAAGRRLHLSGPRPITQSLQSLDEAI